MKARIIFPTESSRSFNIEYIPNGNGFPQNDRGVVIVGRSANYLTDLLPQVKEDLLNYRGKINLEIFDAPDFYQDKVSVIRKYFRSMRRVRIFDSGLCKL